MGGVIRHDAGSLVGARNFFKITNRANLFDKVDSEYAKFMDYTTGELRNDLDLIDRVCPVCQCKEYAVTFYKYGFPHLLCAKCSMLYVSPVLSEKELNSFYT